MMIIQTILASIEVDSKLVCSGFRHVVKFPWDQQSKNNNHDPFINSYVLCRQSLYRKGVPCLYFIKLPFDYLVTVNNEAASRSLISKLW